LGNLEGQFADTHGADEKLAKDVARLYSWANVEDALYHDFSKHRKVRNKPAVPAEKPQESSVPSNPDNFAATSENSPQAPEIPVATAPGAIPDYLAPAESPANWKEPPPHQPQSVQPDLAAPLPGNVVVETGLDLSVPELTASTEANNLRPVLALYSLAGGVGKTTLCANLGRALCSTIDRVLLIDASGTGMLPFYFGANDMNPGVQTRFAEGAFRTPLRVIDAETVSAEWLEDEVKPEMETADWTIFDLGPASANLLPQIFAMSSVLLVPLLPDLNSILAISRLESSLQAMRSKGFEIPTPFYIFNQFDPQDPIDQGARDLVVRQCGGRLLPFSIGQDSEAARAIASRKTVIDQAPGSQIAIACVRLAALFRTAATSNRARWSPRSCAEI
jgi:cellulose biosynthesis protein BcsQ